MDLMRKLMLKLEGPPVPLSGLKAIDGQEPAVQVEGGIDTKLARCRPFAALASQFLE
jgi:hypothetical protein